MDWSFFPYGLAIGNISLVVGGMLYGLYKMNNGNGRNIFGELKSPDAFDLSIRQLKESKLIEGVK